MILLVWISTSANVVLCVFVPSLTKRAASVSVQAAEVEIEDVSRAYTLFIDVKRSTEFLVAHESDYMFNQVRKCAAACMPRRHRQTMYACARQSEDYNMY